MGTRISTDPSYAKKLAELRTKAYAAAEGVVPAAPVRAKLQKVSEFNALADTWGVPREWRGRVFLHAFTNYTISSLDGDAKGDDWIMCMGPFGELGFTYKQLVKLLRNKTTYSN